MKIFVDSNIPMYVAGRDHANRAPAMRLLARIRDGELDAYTSTEVLQEVLYRYSGLGRLDLARSVYDLFVQLVPVVWPVTLADTDRCKEILCSTRGITARDALHAATMLNNGVSAIATFDRDFDRVPEIERFDLTG